MEFQVQDKLRTGDTIQVLTAFGSPLEICWGRVQRLDVMPWLVEWDGRRRRRLASTGKEADAD